MPGNVTRGCATLGTDALAHMAFLIRSPQRVLALRLALTRVIQRTSAVLDAGCGALGLLAIMAARLGASRVVAVDMGDLDLAKALAAENGVADRIEFVRGDLESVDLATRAFDVLIGMIYNNDPRLDLPQQRLMLRLIERYAHPGSAVIPNRVRYAVAGYDYPAPDAGDSTHRAEWETHIGNAERHAGMSFAAVQELLDRGSLPGLASGTEGRKWNSLGYFDRSTLTLLTERRLFTEVDYTSRARWPGYPESFSLRATRAGRLSAVVWQQDLVFDDILIRTTESLGALSPPQLVKPNDVAVLATSPDRWKEHIPLSVEKS